MTIRRPLRGFFEFTERFSRLSRPVLFGAWCLAMALAGWAWRDWRVALAFGLLAVYDGAMLAALPRFGRSYGPPHLPWLGLVALRLLLAVPSVWLPLTVGAAAQVGVALAATYACWVEPLRLGVTHVTLRSPRLNGGPPLRLLHITDLHVERVTGRERRLLELVAQLSPDVIVVTGDYLNISYTFDETAHRHAREFLRQLCAPGGVFAITGSPSVDLPEVVARVLDVPNVTWLRDDLTALTWHENTVQIAGVACSYDVAADERKLAALLKGRADDAFTVLLYHTPDVMPAAVKAGVDLYLAGHTHGGQLRLPGFGALITASIYWKRYEMGLYRDGKTTLYVSRGVGLEGKGAPRARFLCPPEVVLFTLSGDDEKADSTGVRSAHRCDQQHQQGLEQA